MESHDVSDDVTNRRTIEISYKLRIGHEPLNHSVSEILSTKVGGQTDRQTRTHIDT